MRFQPLLITATTPHGVVLSRPWGIAFDGLLASVLWDRQKWAARASGTWLTYNHEHPPQRIDLPLALCGDPDHHDDWHWMATFADLHPHHATEPDIRWRTSRTDHQRLQQLAPVIGRQAVSDRAGRYQRRVVPVLAHPATSVTWRAVGDPYRIHDLLSELTSIGKHRGVGEGVVTGWDITAPPELDEWSAGHEHSTGVLGRPTPQRCLTQHPVNPAHSAIRTAIRPPYLHPTSRVSAYPPDR